MEVNKYQELAMRTDDGRNTERLLEFVLKSTGILKRLHRKCKYVCDYSDELGDAGRMINACLGLSGEVGETCDIIKKHIFHEKELDEVHLKKEIGDICWYIAEICTAFYFDLDEIMALNIEKLQARFPNGFDPARANHRKDGDI